MTGWRKPRDFVSRIHRQRQPYPEPARRLASRLGDRGFRASRARFRLTAGAQPRTQGVSPSAASAMIGRRREKHLPAPGDRRRQGAAKTHLAAAW